VAGPEPARPAVRLLARMIDATAQFAPLLLLPVPGALDLGPATLVLVLPLILAFVVLPFVQAVLISRTGASLGKMLVGIRIVVRDGTPAGFVQGWLLRSFVFGALELVASVVLLGLPSLVDALMVFTRRGRTLHDRMAGTYVVKARSSVHSAASSI
jgi:uncharacterized RDD family membrane protein YckC